MSAFRLFRHDNKVPLGTSVQLSSLIKTIYQERGTINEITQVKVILQQHTAFTLGQFILSCERWSAFPVTVCEVESSNSSMLKKDSYKNKEVQLSHYQWVLYKCFHPKWHTLLS